MKIPFGDLKRHYQTYKTEIDAAVARVLESGWFILGRELEAFEQAFAEYLGVPYAVGVGSGTEALHLALVASGVEPGDEVITVPNTAVPTISAISFANAVPVFVDVDRHSYCINTEMIEEKISERTRAIIPVHLYGNVCVMDKILQIAERHEIAVIEDACQAHGAAHRGRKAGTFGDYGCFSFYPSKNLGAFGDGGIVVSADKQNAEKIRLLRNYGQSKRYYHEIEGFNSRLDEIQSAILSVQLPYLDGWNQRRREIAGIYCEQIHNDGVVLPSQQKDSHHIFHLFVIRCTDRDRLRSYLQDNGVGTQIHYPIPCHLQSAYKQLGLGPGTCPVAERYAVEILSLPIFPEMTDEEVRCVSDKINRFK